MQKALSAENIAELARGTLQGLKRFIPRRQEGGYDESDPLTVACKGLEEKVRQGGVAASVVASATSTAVPAGTAGRIDLAEISQMFEHFAATVEAQSQQSVASATAAVSTGEERTPSGLRKKPFELMMLYFMEVLHSLFRSQGVHVVRAMIETQVLPNILRVMLKPLPNKVVDCFLNGLRTFFLASSTLFSATAEVIVQVLEEGKDDPALQLRLLLLLHQVFRQIDVSANPASPEMKERLEEHGLIDLLLQRADSMRKKPSHDPSGMAVGLLSLAVVGSLFRNHGEHKVLLLDSSFLELWVYYASNISRLQCTFTSQVTLMANSTTTGGGGVLTEEQTVVFESTAFWAGELAEMIMELCTAGSITLRRQEATAGTPAPSVGGISVQSSPSPAASTIGALASQQWSALPANWADVLKEGGTMMVWALASASSSCILTATSALKVLHALSQLTINTGLAESIYCNVLAIFLLLCRASPVNSTVLSQCGAFRRTICLMSPRSAIFQLEENKNVVINVTQDKAWAMTTAFFTTLCVNHFAEEELSIIMRGIDRMIVADYDDTSAADCLIIEHCNTVLAEATFSPYCYWFDGTSTRLAVTMDRFCGRWNGYTFACWICTSCVWPEGGLIYGFSETEKNSNLAVMITTSRGGKKCLAVRSRNVRADVTILKFEEAVLEEEWNHVALVHNIGGFNVFVNGKKCSLSKDVPYPKVPPQPHKLNFFLGGGDRDLMVPPLFGMMTSPQFFETNLSDRDIDRLATAGPGSSAKNLESNLHDKIAIALRPANPISRRDSIPTASRDTNTSPIAAPAPLMSSPQLPPAQAEGPIVGSFSLKAGEGDLEEHNVTCDVEFTGSYVKADAVGIRGALYHPIPNLSKVMKNCDVIGWASNVVQQLATSENSACVVILCMQLVAAYLKQSPIEIRNQFAESTFFIRLKATLLNWPEIPPEVLCTLFHLVTTKDHRSKRLVNHPSTHQCIQTVLDVLAMKSCPLETKSEALKEFGGILAVADNAKIFRETPKSFVTLLAASRDLEGECVNDFIMVVEKVVREPAELEMVLKFLMYEPESQKSTVIKCELARMMYDVTRLSATVAEMIANANGVHAMLMLIQGSMHHSEALRVYALRLLALLLHCSKKQKDLFVKANGYEALAHSLLRHATAAPITLPTYNCVFKMALDFFQPNNSVEESVILGGLGKPTHHKHVDPHSNAKGASSNMPPAVGHLPSIMPRNQGAGGQMGMRSMSYGSVTGSSECSDLEARLSLDDAYNSQLQRDSIVNPMCIYVGLQLLSQSFQQMHHTGSTQALSDGATEVDAVGSDIPSSETSETTVSVAYRVLSYFDRMVDLTHNANSLMPYPWLDWIWTPYSSFLASEQKFEFLTRSKLDLLFRSIIRKLAVADLSRNPKSSAVKKVKDMCDVPQLQCCVIEEIVRHFSSNNRLDSITDAMEAQNSLRNLDTLLMSIDECIQPLPQSLVLEIVNAISAIAVNNNNWVRAKMKNGKLFETRDKLAFLMFVSVKNFAAESHEVVSQILQAVINDGNTVLHLLKLLADAIKETSVEKVEVLQSMLRTANAEEDHHRALVRLVDDGADILLGRSSTPLPEDAQGEKKAASNGPQDVISWSKSNEEKWNQLSARIYKAYRPLESELQVKADRRDKEAATRLKARKAELERKMHANARVAAENDKAIVDYQGKASGYTEVVADAKAARTKRVLEATAALEGSAQLPGTPQKDPAAGQPVVAMTSATTE